jgi:hypothetical protein
MRLNHAMGICQYVEWAAWLSMDKALHALVSLVSPSPLRIIGVVQHRPAGPRTQEHVQQKVNIIRVEVCSGALGQSLLESW